MNGDENKNTAKNSDSKEGENLDTESRMDWKKWVVASFGFAVATALVGLGLFLLVSAPNTPKHIVFGVVVCEVLFMGAVAWGAMVFVPPVHFAIVERLGRRTGRVLYEGLNLVWPFIESVDARSRELVTIPVVADFTTKDKLHVRCEGSLQYYPDPSVTDAKGRCIFVAMSLEAIKNGIVDGIRSKLGSIGGSYNGESFINKRLTVSQIINATLRLGAEPHERHVCGSKDPKECNVPGCKYEGPVKIGDLLSFYEKHWPMVKIWLGEEDKTPHDRSNVERRHGIDIIKFALADVDFSQETRDAFEKEKQVAAKEGANRRQVDMAKEIIGEIQRTTPQMAQIALNAVHLLTNPASVKKQVISVEGDPIVGASAILGGIKNALVRR